MKYAWSIHPIHLIESHRYIVLFIYVKMNSKHNPGSDLIFCMNRIAFAHELS